MISVKKALQYHDALIEEFGGSKGVRDMNSLESALSRPFATFDGNDLYPGPIEKASAILESLIINHPFVDGNKRIAYALMQLVLLKSNLYIETSEDHQYEFVIKASTGEIRFEEIKSWIAQNVISLI